MPKRPLLLGIDVGTGGVRGIVASNLGDIVTESRVAWTEGADQPSLWWASLCEVVQDLLRQLGRDRERLKGLSVVSTSGTLVLADERGEALGDAIMYNDPRAHREAEELESEGHEVPYRWSSSFTLPKVHWVRQHELDRFAKAAYICHPADWLVGKLTGHIVSDYSNALKMGYGLHNTTWPNWIDPEIRTRLPRVYAPGRVVGHIQESVHRQTGLPLALGVMAGATDGVAGAVASGLHKPGDYSTTLGTTLVFKGMSDTPVEGPNLYSHRLAEKVWLPGAASNTGASWISHYFGGEDPRDLDRKAAGLLPTAHLSYPLVGKGERFPFSIPAVEGFVNPPSGHLDRYASCLQGTAFVERLAYSVLDAALGTVGGRRVCYRRRQPQRRLDAVPGGRVSAHVFPRGVSRGGHGRRHFGCSGRGLPQRCFSGDAQHGPRYAHRGAAPCSPVRRFVRTIP